MTAPASVYPRTIDALMPDARQLAERLDRIPSRNQLMKEFRIGAPKADLLRDELTAELTRPDPWEHAEPTDPDPGVRTEPEPVVDEPDAPVVDAPPAAPDPIVDEPDTQAPAAPVVESEPTEPVAVVEPAPQVAVTDTRARRSHRSGSGPSSPGP